MTSLPIAAFADPQSFAQQLVDAGAPGAGVGIYQNGKSSCEVAGIRALGQDAPVEAGDLWHIGSLTKSMTATLTARLVERGVIDWNTSVGDILDFDIPDQARAITVTQLLSHRSGLPANLSMTKTLHLVTTHGAENLQDQRLGYAKAILSGTLKNPPGNSFEYSNAGYVVLGTMLEKQTGRSWETLMQDEILTPLGLSSAGFGPPGNEGKLDQPRGHQPGLLWGMKSVEPGPYADNPAVIGPAGTVHIALCDLLSYTRAHLEKPADYLSPETWDALHQDRGDSYGFGWGLSPTGTLSHAGSNTLWYAVIAVWPHKNITAAIVANDGRGNRMDSAMFKIMQEISN